MSENKYNLAQLENNLPPEHLTGSVRYDNEHIQIEFPGAHVLITPTGSLSKDELLNLSNLMSASAAIVPDLLQERNMLKDEKALLLSTISFLAEIAQRALGNESAVNVKINSSEYRDGDMLL